jgi:hypothetical protein
LDQPSSTTTTIQAIATATAKAKAKAKAKANPPRPLRERRPLFQRGQRHGAGSLLFSRAGTIRPFEAGTVLPFDRATVPPFKKGGLGGICFCLYRPSSSTEATANPPRPLRERRPLFQRGQQHAALPGRDANPSAHALIRARSTAPLPNPHVVASRDVIAAPSRRTQRKPS